MSLPKEVAAFLEAMGFRKAWNAPLGLIEKSRRSPAVEDGHEIIQP
jgi:hypothetical protein